MTHCHHEDYDLEFGGLMKTVDGFVREDFVLASRLEAEIDAVLATHPTDELDTFVESFDSSLDLRSEPGGNRKWLIDIAQRSRQRLVSTPHVRDLLDAMEESFWAMGYLPLYELTWTLRGLRRGLTDEEMHAISSVAFQEFRRRHPAHLVWSRWPIDLDASTPAEDAELDFDLDPDESPQIPLLVLVSDDY